MTRFPWLILLLSCSIFLFSACPDEPDGDADADADADADVDGDGDGDGDLDLEFEVEPPEPPEAPASPDSPEPPTPPVLTPCPTGWREVPPDEPDGVTVCDPWPEGGPLECTGDEAHFTGEPGCTRIGTACPARDWAEDLPADANILYVRAGELAGGDGSQLSPLGTIADAMAVAFDGTVIALSKGTFDEEVQINAGVTLWGPAWPRPS